MSDLLKWKFDVINDSLEQLFVLVEKNEHPQMLEDLKSYVNKTGKFELDDASLVSITDWFDVLSDETLKSFKKVMYEKSRKRVRVAAETKEALETLQKMHKFKNINDVIIYLLDIYNECHDQNDPRPYVNIMP
ncbi:MAG: hypothetical protein L0G80_19515 [Shewanella sp.]|uniref:hypothetical protein n=1 Tax=Shewanella sp. TaxID=50422 RepID=UPI00264A47A0|nr:hypothetical protein [Shewanella sp.]MDN5502088.1 hypothetical protein [Shewanella sp.]